MPKQHRELGRGLDAGVRAHDATCYLCQQTTPSPLDPVFRMTRVGPSHEGPCATVHTRHEVPALPLVTRTEGPAACDSDRRVGTRKRQLSFCINGTQPPQVDTGASWRQGRLSRPQEPWAIEALSRRLPVWSRAVIQGARPSGASPPPCPPCPTAPISVRTVEPAASPAASRDKGLPWQLAPHPKPLPQAGLRVCWGSGRCRTASLPCGSLGRRPHPRAVTPVLCSGPEDGPLATVPHSS